MAAQVFAIPELFEAILLELLLTTLVLSQRTSQVFIDTIRDSVKLQQALFFAPIPNTSANLPGRSNPLLFRL
jgi:hypothetical protein